MPKLTGPLVVALLYDQLCTFEFGIAAEVFGLDRPELGIAWYRFASCAIEHGPLRAHGGFTINANGPLSLLDIADLIIVPGWKNAETPVPPELCDKLCDAHARGARLVSICSGAFVLAATGLLNGTVATTHWRYADALRRRFPEVEIDEKSLYRINDRVCTSAGSAAGIDLLIEIVRQDFGTEFANSVARRLVMPAHRTGGQAQFLEGPVSAGNGSRIAPLLDTVRSDLSACWTITRMASEAGLSSRTFLRRFAEAMGTTPGDWLVAERVEAAKRLLCDNRWAMEDIAASVGFGSAHTLRHHFRQKMGISPTEFRSRFAR
jgi:AraC family transcriptional regulator, transcriptional activator FtrA